MAVVIDTDVASFFFKEDTRSVLYEPHIEGQFLFLSFMTLAELRRWTLKYNWGVQKKIRFEKYLRRYSIKHSTPELCLLWAEITDAARLAGKTIAVPDAWIAATAVYFDVPLVTHNGEDFKYVSGLTVISEQ